MKDTNKLIVNSIRELLKKKGLTQKDLSKGISVSKTTINNWINERSKIDAVTLKLIANYFNVPIGYFFEEESGTSPNNRGNINNNGVILAKNGNVEINIAQEEIRHLKKEIESCRALVKELRQRINDKEEVINLLKNK